MKPNQTGKVYVLTNDLMPGIVKIGITEGKVEDRIKSLDNTSLPMPFRFYFAIETERFKEIELLTHNAFSAFRVRENREFFQIDPERVVAALKISGAPEVKIGNEMIDEEGNTLVGKIVPSKSKGKRLRFSDLGIPVNAILQFTRDETKTATVLETGDVQYEGVAYSLTALADKLMRDLGYNWKSIQGPAFFEYNGTTLAQIRKDFESNAEDDSGVQEEGM